MATSENHSFSFFGGKFQFSSSFETDNPEVEKEMARKKFMGDCFKFALAGTVVVGAVLILTKSEQGGKIIGMVPSLLKAI